MRSLRSPHRLPLLPTHDRLLVEWVYVNDSQLQRPWGEANLSQLMHAYEFRYLVGEQTLGRSSMRKTPMASSASGWGTSIW
jgi:hypothetical protein